MKYLKMNSLLSCLIISILSSAIFGQQKFIKPVTPNASAETVALLELIYSISGKYILTGQHNYPNIKDRNTRFATDYIGKTPVVFSTDWGFEKDGNTDSYLARPDIVKEVIRQHQKGSIITICWHAVPPTASEPVTFRPLPGAKSDSLVSVQGQLTDQQFKDILTPGTLLYKHWCSQVDSIAKYLKMLQEAHVPILWRPYHEMNGNWFWWGGRQGTYSTAALYKQLFDRLVKVHKINNLVWIWSMDRPNSDTMQFKNFYPGTNYIDILSLDVYRNDFKQENYNNLLALSEGKPMVLGEVGNPPNPEILENQPLWAYYSVWAGMVRNTSKKQYDVLLNNKRFLFQEDKSYIECAEAYRKACNLPPLLVDTTNSVNLSGNWVFNEEKSSIGNSGAASLPYKISIVQQGNTIRIFKTFVPEFVDNRVDTLKLTTDGSEYHSLNWNSPMKTTANWTLGNDTLKIKMIVTFTHDNQSTDYISNENWYLTELKRTLCVEQHSNSFWGSRDIIMKFDKTDMY
jgi:mannan endo-1,4-beta-mannosidase